MDFLITHWAPYPRRFPSSFPLANAAYVPRKDHWIKGSYNSCNFSIILRGRGEFNRAGKRWIIEAPCVLTQWPGEYVEYGPPVPAETWDELYLMYDGRLFERFKRCRLVDPQRPVWPITDLEAVATQIAEFEILANSHSPASIVDRVDRVCERLIMETHDVCPPETSTHRGIRKLIAQVQRHPGKVVNFDALASQNGMSIATFRRRWTEACKLPPARFLRQVRMREACRLLAETSRLIGEIAREIGFEDELYFSRCFHQETKMAPRDYRKTYQIGVPSK